MALIPADQQARQDSSVHESKIEDALGLAAGELSTVISSSKVAHADPIKMAFDGSDRLNITDAGQPNVKDTSHTIMFDLADLTPSSALAIISNQSNLPKGDFVTLIVRASTGKSISSWGAEYQFKDDTDPVLTTTDGKLDVFLFKVINQLPFGVGSGNVLLEVSRTLNVDLV